MEKPKIIIAALTIAASTMIGAPIVSSVAFAAAPPSASETLNTEQSANLTIVKHAYENDGTDGKANNGRAQSDVKGATIQGVTFKVKRISSLDLKQAENWAKIKKYYTALQASDGTVAGAETAIKGVDSATLDDGVAAKATSSTGEVSFENLPIGLYLVEETESTDKEVVTGKPFLVTLPTSDKTDEGKSVWNYDVHIYPKNDKLPGNEFKKSVDESTVVADGNLMYDITFPIPILNTKTIAMMDKLDSHLDAANATVEVSMLTADDQSVSTVTFTKDTDYKVYMDGQTVIVNFTADGVAKATDAEINKTNPKAKLKLHIVAPLKAGAGAVDAGASIDNKAHVYINDPGINTTDQPSVPECVSSGTGTNCGHETTEVSTHFFKAELDKVNEDDVALKGAKFKLYESSKSTFDTSAVVVEAKNLKTLEFNNCAASSPESITAEPDGTVETPESGKICAIGLPTTADGTNAKTYWWVETAAPDGYVLDTTPHKVEYSSGDSVVTKVTNSAALQLPLTGGAGLYGMIGLGVLLLGGAGVGGTVVYKRNKKSNA